VRSGTPTWNELNFPFRLVDSDQQVQLLVCDEDVLKDQGVVAKQILSVQEIRAGKIATESWFPVGGKKKLKIKFGFKATPTTPAGSTKLERKGGKVTVESLKAALLNAIDTAKKVKEHLSNQQFVQKARLGKERGYMYDGIVRAKKEKLEMIEQIRGVEKEIRTLVIADKARLIVTVREARQLIKGVLSSTDAYCRVWFEGFTRQTKTLQTTEPNWNETFKFLLTEKTVKSNPPVKIGFEIFDQATILGADTRIGFVEVSLGDVLLTPDLDRWYKLGKKVDSNTKSSENVSGDLHIRFQFVPSEVDQAFGLVDTFLKPYKGVEPDGTVTVTEA